MKVSRLVFIPILFFVAIIFSLIRNPQNVSASANPAEALRLAADETLLLQLYVDKGEYNAGDDILFSARLSMNGYGIASAQVCTSLKDDAGVELWGSCDLTDAAGWFYATLEAGYAIPTGYTGYLRINVTGAYDGQETAQEMRVAYGLGSSGDDDDGEGELSLSIVPSGDKYDYTQGENVTLNLVVTYAGQPLASVNICPVITDEDGVQLAQVCADTNANGSATYLLAYGSQIPAGYIGDLVVWANVYYAGEYAERGITLTYMPAQSALPLDLELWGPLVPVQIGGWEEIQLGGTLTSQGVNVDGATVNLAVAGNSYQTSTGLAESGKFYYGWPNTTFPAGEYTVQVTVSKAGYQSASGTVHFTVFGGEHDFAVVMDPIPAVLPPGTNVPFPGTLTLGGNPVADWVQIDITRPNGTVESFSNLSDAAGRFTHTQASLMELGTYQLVVYYQSDFKQISPVYTFTVGEGGETPPTVTPAAPSPAQVAEKCEIIEVVYPATALVGENVNISGKVVCTQNEEEITPKEGWDVHVFDMHSSAKAPVVQTSMDGSFTAAFPAALGVQEITILARDPEIETRHAHWFGPLKVVVGLEPEISLSQSAYDQGEILEGTLTLNPGYPAENWDAGLEIYYQITGPEGEGAKQYWFESQYLYVNPQYYIHNILDQIYWTVPQEAGGGKYTLTAYISGSYMDLYTLETDFYVNDIQHTNLTAWVESDPDGWVSATLVGQFTDFNGVPIPEADVRVEFFIVKWNDEGTEIIGTRAFQLTGATDAFGSYAIDLEPLDLFVGQGQENPWEPNWATTTVYADKEGYATGSAMLDIRIPTVKAQIEIISVNPPLDYLSKMAQGGLSYEQLTEMTIQIRVRYNNIFVEGAKLGISAEGDWAVNCDEVGDRATFQAYLDINGQKMPEWSADKYMNGWEWYQNMVAWPNGTHYPFWYYYPKHSVAMPAQHGIAQESTISVSGKLFGYKYSENSPNRCGGTPGTSSSPAIPPDWVAARPAVKIQISLGEARAGVIYNISPPSISASGSAWVSPTTGEFNASINVGQATGYALANQPVSLSVIAANLGVTEITSVTAKPTSEITLQGSAVTDDKGVIKLPLTAKSNPCELKDAAQYYVQLTSPALGGQQNIPIELRCIEKLEFEMNDGAIALVQATDLSDQQPLRLAAGKEAGVRVYYAVRGEIYQPVNKPVSYLVKFELLPSGASIPVETQVKRVSLTEKGATVSWADSSKAPNQAGIGLVTKWEETPTEIEGSDLTDIDFVFTPFQGNGKFNQFKIRITIDPDEVYGQKIEQTIDVTVQTMKTLRLIIVPVNFIDNLDMSFVFNQVEFLHETYPLGISNLILDLRDSYYATEIPLTCASMTYLKEIACGLGTKYGTGGDANTLTKIVGIVENETWQIGWWDNQGTMGAYAATFWDSATTNVALVRHHPYNPANTTAHEIGHMLGLELSEQYKTNPPNGIPVNGLILKDSQIFDIPSDYQIPKMTGGDRTKTVNSQWGASFGSTTSGITDLMGNAGYYLHENGKDVVAESHNRSWVIPKTYISLLDALADPPDEEIFFVQGIIGLDGFVSLNPMVQMEGLPDEPSTAGEYELQIQSSAGEILYNTRFGSAAKPGLFELHLPYTPGMGRMVVLNGGAMVAELLRSPNPPQVSFSPFPAITDESETITISWTGSDPDGDALTYSLHYHCAEPVPWVPLVANLTASTYEINLTHMPGGACTLKVIASDGVNTAMAVSDFVSPPQGPRVQILTEAATYHAEEPILLKGLAVDLLEGVLPDENLRWFSDVDGDLGVGRALWARLSPGNHTLTLYAQDSAGNTAAAQAVIPVEEDTPLAGMGNGLQGLWFLGCIGVVGLLGVGGVFAGVGWLRKRGQTAPQPGAVQDAQGRWWRQDARTGAWFLWNGQAWQPVASAPPSQPLPRRRGGGGSCLLSLLLAGGIGVVVVGGLSLAAFGFFPGHPLTPRTGDPAQILKMGGGGLLVSILGLLLLNSGIKAIRTGRAIVKDEYGRRREKRGCGAVLNGLGQLTFGALLLTGGLGWITLVFYQEVLPWLGL